MITPTLLAMNCLNTSKHQSFPPEEQSCITKALDSLISKSKVPS